MVCPVCRESTYLGQNRVAGLKPNFIARNIQDKLHVVLPSQNFCPFHANVHNDIFCEDCKEFICLACFLVSHKDHKIKKKEELEVGLKEKRDSLIRESGMKKAQIEEFLNNAEQHRIDMQCHFGKVEKKIKDEFAKRVTILQRKEETLLNELDSIRKETTDRLVGRIAFQKQTIDDIKQCSTIIKGCSGKNVDSDAIKTQYLQCNELEKSLKRGINEESIVRLKHTAESTRFRPSDEKLLALGHIEVGVKEISNVQVKTATGAKRKSEPSARKNVAVIPPPVRSKSLKIVRQVEATNRIWCMAAQSQDAVVVGYGKFVSGSDRFSVSGEKTQHLKSEVGGVCGIAFLTDGRSVVSHGKDTLRVYGTNRLSTGMQYTSKEGVYYTKLCVDQDDNIYAVNGDPEIYIFHGSNSNPQRVIPKGNIKPTQICLTKTGALFTRGSCNRLDTLTVYDKEDHVGSSITASDGNEYLHATVDSQDSVLVARVRRRSDVFRLTRYTLQGTTLIQQVTFNELKLPRAFGYSYGGMTSLTPNLIAFTDYEHLHFIELDE